MKYIYSIMLLSLVAMSCGTAEEKTEDNAQPKKEAENGDAINDLVTLDSSQLKIAGITLDTPKMRQLSGTFRASGLLDVPPQQQVSISVPMGGFLRKTDLLQGKYVRKGELLAVIENPDYVPMQQAYLEAKSQLEYAKADYDRQKLLSADSINAFKAVEKAKTEFRTLQAQVSALRERIRSTGLNLRLLDKGDVQSSIYLYAPISGYVTDVNVNIGKFVQPADILFEIVDTEHLHVELTVFEKDIPKLKIGQKVRFTLANETKERLATVFLIGREIDKDRSVRIHCHIDKEDRHLLPGMYLQAVVETGGTDVLSLPEEAVVGFEGKNYVFIQSENSTEKADSGSRSFRMKAVQTGIADQGFVEISFPWHSNNPNIVTKGAYSLLSVLKNSGEEE